MPDDLTRELAVACAPLARLHDVAVNEGAMDRGHMVSFLGSIRPEELHAAARALARFDAREGAEAREPTAMEPKHQPGNHDDRLTPLMTDSPDD